MPPDYDEQEHLHGYSIGAAQWSKEIHVPQTIEGAFALGAHEMIVVLPDSKTVHNGSMYSSSPTTGDFESYVARDVVAYMDSHYRTLPVRCRPDRIPVKIEIDIAPRIAIRFTRFATSVSNGKARAANNDAPIEKRINQRQGN